MKSRSIHGAVYSNDLVNLTSLFGLDVQDLYSKRETGNL